MAVHYDSATKRNQVDSYFKWYSMAMSTQTKPQIVLLAGGSNSRFFPLNTETHKGFLTLLGKPIVVRTLENIKKYGFTDIIIVVSEKDFGGKGLSGQVDTHTTDMNITWVLQKNAKGQGDALLSAQEHISDNCIVSSPYYQNAGELAQTLWEEYQTEKSECVFMGTKITNPSLYGMLAFDESDPKRITAVIEKPEKNPPSDFKINSVYLLSKKFISFLEEQPTEEYALEKAFTQFCQKERVTWIENTQTLPSLKYAWQLFEMVAHLFSQEKSRTSATATISKTAVIDDSAGPVIIEDEARIGDFVKILGPCYIGKKAFIGDYSFVRNGCVIEAGSTVGSNTEVVRSIILSKSSIHFGYIADSILGEHVKIGAGLITANKRLDRKIVRTRLQDKMVEMASNAHGIIVGANTQFGVGVRTMPGVLIGSGVMVEPATTISRNIPHTDPSDSTS